MAQVEGEVFSSRWNCVLDYSTSTSWNSVSVSGTCIFRSRGYGMNLNGFYAHVDINGNTNSTENTSFYSPNGGWVDKSIISHSQSFSRTHSDYTIYINACIDRRGSSYAPGKSIPTAYITIPAIEHHTVSYNANGGSGAPSSQTKWYGTVLTLSSTRPTRTGYTFQGWATSASGAVAYQPGGQYGADSDVTLYAVWKANTWTVRFDANGGSGAPSAQTKTYGIDLTLSTTKPTRALYNFLGWATTANGAVAYAPGAKYTANADITLYAVWELAWIAPKLSNHDCFRCNQNGVADDIGTYCRLVGDWVTDRTVRSITATVNGVSTTISGSGKAGSIAVTLGAGALSAETSYTVKLVITDEIGSGEWNWTIAATHYILDFAPNGSVGVGTVADGSTKVFDTDIINRTSKLWTVGGVRNVNAPSNSGYFNFLTITLKEPWANDCLNFKVAQRNREICELYIRFYSADTTEETSIASLYQIATSNGASPFKYTYTYGVLKVYSPISEPNDRIGVVEAWYDAFHTERGYFPYDIDYSGTYYSTLPDGANDVTIKWGGIIPGSGLALSDRGVLSVGTNYRNVSIPTKNKYIKIYLSRIGPLVMFRFYAYRSDRLDWLGHTNGSKWGWKIATIPDWAIPDVPSDEDSASFYHPVYNRFWDGNALFSINIRTNKDVQVNWNCTSGYPNTIDFTDIYLAKN